MRSLGLVAVVAAFAFSSAVAADRSPPQDAMPLSQILAQIEAQPDFHYFKDIDWDNGRYEIEYRTRDGGKHEIKVDPKGQARR